MDWQTSNFFPKLKSFGGKLNAEVDLSNYAAKANLKNGTGIDTSKFAKKLDLASLNTEEDRSAIWKVNEIKKMLIN